MNNILLSHNDNNISLSSLVHIMMISYILMTSLYYIFLKYILVKTDIKPLNILKKYYTEMTHSAYAIDIVYTGFVFSITLIMFRILSKKYDFNQVKLFFIIFNCMIIFTDIVFAFLLNKKTETGKIYMSWGKSMGFINVILHDIILFNIVAILGFNIIKHGYSNIIIAPVYTILLTNFII